METNIVVPKFMDSAEPPFPPGPPADSRPIVITIKEWTVKRCSKAGGKVYFLSRATAGLSREEKLPIFWLAYKQKDATQATLSGTSRYMFTVLMNGCSLGFGSQAGDGACLVSHANAADAGAAGPEAQRDAQTDQLTAIFGAGGFNQITPDAYRPTTHGVGFEAANFGKNVSGTWSFYTHKFLDLNGGRRPGVVLHGGVAPAVTVPG